MLWFCKSSSKQLCMPYSLCIFELVWSKKCLYKWMCFRLWSCTQYSRLCSHCRPKCEHTRSELTDISIIYWKWSDRICVSLLMFPANLHIQSWCKPAVGDPIWAPRPLGLRCICGNDVVEIRFGKIAVHVFFVFFCLFFRSDCQNIFCLDNLDMF